MKVCSVICQKGGTAKTTVATNLAVEAMQHGLSVVLVDIDPQVSASKWRDLRKAAEPTVVHTAVPYLERCITTAREAGADLVLIDSAGRMDDALFQAASHSDLALIAVQPTTADLFTIASSAQSARIAGAKALHVVLTRVRPIGTREETARAILAKMDLPVCPSVLGERFAYQDAFAAGQGVVESDPSSKSAQEIRALFAYIAPILKLKLEMKTDGKILAHV